MRKETWEKVRVTPARAQSLLETIDQDTYRWSRQNYELLLADMQDSAFDSLASWPLVVDFDGRLWNGRHRLTAQLRANKTYIYWVHTCSRDMAQRVQRFGDAGKSWSAHDELKARGETNQSILANALTYVYRFLIAGAPRGKRTATTARKLELLDKNKGLRDWASTSTVAVAARRLRISKGMCTAVAHMAQVHGVPEAEIEKFWHLVFNLASPDPQKVAMAASTQGSGPIAAYVQWINQTRPLPGQTARRSELVVWAYLHMAWNAWVQGKKLTIRDFRWDVEKDDFPGLADQAGGMLVPASDRARELLDHSIA